MIMIKTSEQIKIWENTETLLKRIIKINDQSVTKTGAQPLAIG